MGAMSWWHWLIVLAVVLLLFGSKKLPDAARGLGRSMRIFKSEMKEMQNDDAPAAEQQQLPAGGPQAAQYTQPQQPGTAQPVQPNVQQPLAYPDQQAAPQPGPGQATPQQHAPQYVQRPPEGGVAGGQAAPETGR